MSAPVAGAAFSEGTAALALMAAVIIMALRFRHYMRGKYIEEELSLARRVNQP